MKSKRRFIPLVFMGAIIMSLLLILPVFAADGEVRFYDVSDTADDQEWARQGGMVNLEVKDDDLDMDQLITGEAQVAQNGRIVVNNVPVVDRRGSRFLTDVDVDVNVRNPDGTPGATLAVDRVGEDGRIDLRAPDDNYSGPVFVDYQAAVFNNTGSGEDALVTVRSRQEPNGIAVTLTETDSDTGVFRLAIMTTSGDSNADSSPPRLKVAKSDTITLRYNEEDPDRTVTATLRVETTAPSFSEITPANGSAGRADPDVGFRVTDGVSGIDDDDDVAVLYVVADTDGNIVASDIEAGGADPITDGFIARERLSTTLDDATIYWWGKATDRAGNVGISDRKSRIDNPAGDEIDDPCMPGDFPTTRSGLMNLNLSGSDYDVTGNIFGCQPYSVKIDDTKPVVVGGVSQYDADGNVTTFVTRTGAFWDTDSSEDDKTNTDPTKGKANMILVRFSEALDASTVEASDFEVNDNTPSSAEVFSGQKRNVFLTLSTDLSPNAEPKVELVGTVEDLAGNRQTSGTVDEAEDGIAPTLTVMLEGGSRPVTKGDIKVTVTANEDVGTPSVVARMVDDSGAEDNADTEDVDESMYALEATPSSEVEATLKEGETNVYEATLTVASSGLYNVYVTATDANNSANTGKAGVNKGPIDLTDDTKAILFEFDNSVAAPMVLPDDEDGSDNSDPFITIDFVAEGTEYMDNNDVDLDSYGTVTILSASLDSPDSAAMDIAESLVTTDNVIFLYKASDLVKGNHTLTVKARDAAGNEKEFENTVKIVERQPFKLELRPGWNLVSLPSNPTNTSINAIIPADHPANTILSYNAETGWTTAIRSEDGTWLGTLMSIDASSAYWIQTDSFDPIEVDIPRISAGTSVPPSIALSEGWNFVPVTDVSGDLSHGDSMSAKGYFSGTLVNRVYTFDTLMGQWESVDLETGSVKVGSGYWAHASEAGVIAP